MYTLQDVCCSHEQELGEPLDTLVIDQIGRERLGSCRHASWKYDPDGVEVGSVTTNQACMSSCSTPRGGLDAHIPVLLRVLAVDMPGVSLTQAEQHPPTAWACSRERLQSTTISVSGTRKTHTTHEYVSHVLHAECACSH